MRVLTIVVFAVVPLYLVGSLIHYEAVDRATPLAFFDFHAFWGAGKAVLHGHSPYPPASESVLAHETAFVYPAPAAILMVPFALLPFKVAGTLFALILVASIPLALRLLGVRDWRCYGLVLVSAPVANAVNVDAVSPLLLLGLALVWRYRDRVVPAACALAAVVALKLFLWPFLLWFAFTRRFVTALVATALIAVVSLVSWAVIGFDGLREYPDVLRALSHLLEGKGYTPVALALALGAGRTVAQIVPWLIGGAILVLVGLRGRRPGADTWTFTVVLAAAFALSPIAWLHYFILLFLPIALIRPRLSWLWALPLALWVVRGQSDQPLIWQHNPTFRDMALSPRIGAWPQIVFCLGCAAIVFALTAWPRSPRSPEAPA
jgi:hypothetical protein